MTAPATEATEGDEFVDAELVDDEAPIQLLPAAVAGAAPAYRITQDTLLIEGELPPRVDEQPAFTERDFTASVGQAPGRRAGREEHPRQPRHHA
ncbi:hypothetical protein ACFU9X_33840 [Streptomyces atratus]|uniref:hypothetical protein n=1 Tax=Streptomyces atratus TaxID=1893 RepID=UPI0036C54E26